MAYIGNIPAVQYASFSKQTLTADSSTTSFTLDNAVANENEIEVFVNNVRQEPGSGKAYTASGTTLTMSVAPTTGDSFYVIFQGKATQTVTAPAGSVTTSQLADSSVSLAKLTATGTKDATTFLRGDNTFAEAGGGIEMAQQWRVTTNFTGNAEPIASNWEIVDTDGYGGIGSNMTESSGIFTFPSTGIYYISFEGNVSLNGSIRYWKVHIQTTTNNSTYSDAADSHGHISQVGSETYDNASCDFIFDVTDTSTHKVRFCFASDNGSTQFSGNTNINSNSVTFIRLGDT